MNNLGLNTKILMNDYTMKYVNDLKIGDKIMGIGGYIRYVLNKTVHNGKLYKIIYNKNYFIVNGLHQMKLTIKNRIILENRKCLIFEIYENGINFREYYFDKNMNAKKYYDEYIKIYNNNLELIYEISAEKFYKLPDIIKNNSYLSYSPVNLKNKNQIKEINQKLNLTEEECGWLIGLILSNVYNVSFIINFDNTQIKNKLLEILNKLLITYNIVEDKTNNIYEIFLLNNYLIKLFEVLDISKINYHNLLKTTIKIRENIIIGFNQGNKSYNRINDIKNNNYIIYKIYKSLGYNCIFENNEIKIINKDLLVKLEIEEYKIENKYINLQISHDNKFLLDDLIIA
jgi:hypothetical protein